MKKLHIELTSVMLLTIAVISASGCATIVKGTSQSVTVNTDPEGAVCTLSRGGETVAVINPTPETITVDKNSLAITVLCQKEGFEDNTGTLASESEAMSVMGNMLFGGMIGSAIDAGSGADRRYPPKITLTMIPSEFDSIAQRDAFFDRLKADFEREAAAAIERIKQTCSTGQNQDYCDNQVKAAEAGTASRLAEIEKKRHLAKVKAI